MSSSDYITITTRSFSTRPKEWTTPKVDSPGKFPSDHLYTGKEYIKLLKYIVFIVNSYLSPFKRAKPEVFYKQGPGLGYTFTKLRKEKGSHCDFISFNDSFTRIDSEIGGLQLCGTLTLGGKTTQDYEEKKKLIIDELGLIKKKRVKTHPVSGSTWDETYYILDNIKYLKTHTGGEIERMWETY